MAAHALGFIEFSGHGARGMERALDQRLLDPAMRGEPVALSLDTRVQAAMESELGAAVSKFKALAGAGIVLDVKTGRSEEHTSELQSLMRNSYAVLCLQTKTPHKQND